MQRGGFLSDLGFAEQLDALAAIRAERVGHVLHQTEHGNVHHIGHVDGLADDHADQILRGGDDDHAVQRDALENRQRHVARSRRHVDNHYIQLTPGDVLPKLLDRPGDDRAAPDDRRIVVFKHQVDAHYLDALFGFGGEDVLAVAERLVVDAEHARDGGTGDIRIEHADAVAHAAEHDGQLAGDEGFANAALAADDADDLAHLRRLLLGRLGGLIMVVAATGACGLGAALAGRTALLKIRHGKNSFRSGANSGIIHSTDCTLEIQGL